MTDPIVPAPPARPAWPLPPGLYLQPFMDAHGFSHDTFVALTARCHALGVKGVAVHMGPATAQAHWESWARIVTQAGLLAGLIIPGDDQTGLRGELQTAADKGRLLGAIATHPLCAFVGIDAEGAWETDEGPGDQSTKAKALEFGAAFEAVVGPKPHRVPLVTQNWFAPKGHQRFPMREFARYADLELPQVYSEDFVRQFGAHAWRDTFAWYQRDYAAWDAANPDRINPRSATIQGYGWEANAAELDAALALADAAPVMVWCEPFPSAQFEAAMARRMDRLAAGKAAAP